MIPIVGKRMGRPDYSGDVFIQPIPQIRGPLSTTIYKKEFTDVPAGESVSISETFSPTHYILLIDVSASANIYFEFTWIINSIPLTFTGWGRISIPFPAGVPFTTYNATITNRSNEPVNFIYCHYAVLGLEKIIPYQI